MTVAGCGTWCGTQVDEGAWGSLRAPQQDRQEGQGQGQRTRSQSFLHFLFGDSPGATGTRREQQQQQQPGDERLERLAADRAHWSTLQKVGVPLGRTVFGC